MKSLHRVLNVWRVKMKYNANSQREIILPMAFLGLIVSTLNGGSLSVISVSLTVSTICFLLAFIKYTLLINNQTVIYVIQLFGITIYSKEVVSSDIKR